MRRTIISFFLIAIVAALSIIKHITYLNIGLVRAANFKSDCSLRRAAANITIITNALNTTEPSCGNIEKIFVVSLKSRQDRQIISSYLWKKLNDHSKCRLPDVKLVEAFDRNELKNNSVVKYLYEKGWKGFGSKDYAGKAGVYLAHYQLWLHINMTYPNETVLIAEDDQDAYTYSMDMLDEVLSRQKLPENWHVLWLASTRHDNPDPKTRISMNIFKSSPAEDVWGTWVYILSPAGVRQLLHLHRRAMTDAIVSEVDRENMAFTKHGSLKSYYILPKLFSHLPRDVVITGIPESGEFDYHERKMDIIEPLYAANKSRDILSPILAMHIPPLPWEPINASCWDALHSP
jgi:hypothetical protein